MIKVLEKFIIHDEKFSRLSLFDSPDTLGAVSVNVLTSSVDILLPAVSDLFEFICRLLNRSDSGLSSSSEQKLAIQLMKRLDGPRLLSLLFSSNNNSCTASLQTRFYIFFQISFTLHLSYLYFQ